MSKNPYSLLFGKEPSESVPRAVQLSKILSEFSDEMPTKQIYVLTGVRGSGKTVFMSEISTRLSETEDWVVINLNPERDLIQSLASKLSSEDKLSKFFQTAKINLSFFGLGIEIGGVEPIRDLEVAIEKMVDSIAKNNNRLLITIDEAISSDYMKIFAHTYQSMLMKGFPVFLLMTGLYENIHKLKNEKSLTFLYRAPRMELKPLNVGSMASNYQKNFKLDLDRARQMAESTRGYSFAFQVLGYFAWENGGYNETCEEEAYQYLEEYVYEKIWDEMSERDKKMAYGIARSKTGRIKEVRELLGIESNQFNPYRKRLINKGVVNGSRHGFVVFSLPFFERYVLENY
ncbi:MAG: ATP-binding protein [Lachnospiraceae bacterium]|nr:ATP-binding protein [Lachnospiraceae bacterium]